VIGRIDLGTHARKLFDVRVVPTLLGFVVFGLLVSYLRQTPLMAPVDLYLIAWHESMHAAGAWLTGGSVHGIEVRARDGLTWTSGGFFPIISMAGYIGTSLWGAALLASARRPKLILAMGLLTISLPPLAMLVGGGISLSLLAVIGISVALFFAWRRFPLPVTLIVSGLFASESWRDVQMYLFSIPGKTDAGILAKYLGLQLLTLPIALVMAVLSLLIWWIAFRYAHVQIGSKAAPARA
jgi:hypothetical protein